MLVWLDLHFLKVFHMFHMLLINIPNPLQCQEHKTLILVVWVQSQWFFFCNLFFMTNTLPVVNSISWPLCFCALCASFRTSSLTDWGSTSIAQGFWNGWPGEKKSLFYKEHQRALHFMCAMSLSFCPSLFFLSLLFSCNNAECYSTAAFLSLHDSLHLSFSVSLTLHPRLHSIHP